MPTKTPPKYNAIEQHIRKEYDQECYAIGFAPSSVLWESEYNPNRKVDPVDIFEEWARLLYHLVHKTDTSGVVTGGNVYDRNKLAPEISGPSQGIFGNFFEVEMSMTREGESMALVRPVSLLEHA